jgi:tetratricopeptide (TPR) repeat protein
MKKLWKGKLGKVVLVGLCLAVVVGIFHKPILKKLLVGTAGDIAGVGEVFNIDSLAIGDFDVPVSQAFVDAYKLWLKVGLPKEQVGTDTQNIVKYTFEGDALPALKAVAAQALTDTNAYEVLASQYLIVVQYFYNLDIHNAYLEAKQALALAKQSKFATDPRLVNLDQVVGDIEAGKIGTKELLPWLKQTVSTDSQTLETAAQFAQTDFTSIDGLTTAISQADGTYWDNKIAELQKVVSGDYAASQKAEAQYKIAQATKSKFTAGYATLEQVIAEYQKVINNYPGTDYAAKATQEIAQLYATHSTIEHKLLAIQYYTDLLKQIDPFSSQAEGILTTIGNLELEIIREQGKIVEGLALPPLTRQQAARGVLEARRATYLSTAKGTESALGKADGMKLEEAISYLNTLDAQVTAEVAHARIAVKKGQVYEKESKITEAMNTYLYLIDEYPNASTQVDFAKKRIGFYNSSMASGAALSQFTEDYVTILNYNKLLMQEKQTNPAKFHLDVAKRFEASNDLPSALREYQQVCTDYKGTPEFEEAKKKVADIYTAMGRPDKGAAFLTSLEQK